MIRIVHYPLSDRRLGVLHNWHTVPLRRKIRFYICLHCHSRTASYAFPSIEWPKRQKPSSGPARTAGWPAGTPPRPKNGAGVEKTIPPRPKIVPWKAVKYQSTQLMSPIVTRRAFSFLARTASIRATPLVVRSHSRPLSNMSATPVFTKNAAPRMLLSSVIALTTESLT